MVCRTYLLILYIKYSYTCIIVVVHCAAERRPDVAEQDHDGVLRVNV